jgi:hypothetical protein
MREKSPMLTRLLKGFGRFWWDFLVGDTPELFVAVLLTIGLVALIKMHDHLNAVAVVALPALAVAALSLSLWRASKSASRK